MAKTHLGLAVACSGFETVDLCHATGLALWVAQATGGPVTVRRQGTIYALQTAATALPRTMPNMLELLRVPSVKALKGITLQTLAQPSVEIATLDGLLAVLFTARGVRPVSLYHFVSLRSLNTNLTEMTVAKVDGLIQRLDRYLTRPSIQRAILQLQQAYNASNPEPPDWEPKTTNTPIVPMPIAPALSLSTRSPSSRKPMPANNVVLSQPRLAPVLVVIGASRLLRAQRVKENLVNFYLLAPLEFSVSTNFARPILRPCAVPPRQAFTSLALTIACEAIRGPVSLHWHTLQTQGVLQSICVGQGAFALEPLKQLVTKLTQRVHHHWQRLLSDTKFASEVRPGFLIDGLLNRNLSAWLQHCWDVAFMENLSPYTLSDLKEVVSYMTNNPNPQQLVDVLGRESGTLRLGRVLRLLSRYNKAWARDLIVELSSAKTQAQLLRAIAELATQAEIARSKSQFILVPTEDDLTNLLADVQTYGVETTIALLIALSALRYNRADAGEPVQPD